MNKAWKFKYFFTDWKTKKARENQTQNPTAAGAYSTGNWYIYIDITNSFSS